MKIRLSEFIAKYNLMSHYETDIIHGRVPLSAARVVFYDLDNIVSVVSVDSIEKAVKVAIAAERDTNYSLNWPRRLVSVTVLKSGHYSILFPDDVRRFKVQ